MNDGAEFLTAEAFNVAQDLRIFVAMYPNGCCLRSTLEQGDADADVLLTARSAAQTKEHTSCEAMAQGLLTIIPPQRHIAIEIALRGRKGWDDANPRPV